MMWMILQAEDSEDWVIATGTTTTIRDFVRMAFSHTWAWNWALHFRGR